MCAVPQRRDRLIEMDANPEPPIFGADGALTREYLLSRGFCCREGCRHCPYGFEGSEKEAPDRLTNHDPA